MAHIKSSTKATTRDNFKSELMTVRKSENSTDSSSTFFYELEAAIVVDVIRDESHPIFTTNQRPTIERSTWPDNYNDPSTLDYSWIGRIKVRLINSQKQVPTNKLDWVSPIETGIYEYPLVNEVVIVSEYMGRMYYTRRLNTRNFINNNADYSYEYRYGMSATGINEHVSPGSLKQARNESSLWPDTDRYAEPKGNKISHKYLGKYFKANHKIRPLKHYEGDTIIQSRFGSSIRFGCFVNDPSLDVGSSLGYGESHDDNLGNPCILIRNRQKKTKGDEKKYQYNIIEDVNDDGSSIQMTSGRTQSKFVPTLTHSYSNVPYPRAGCVFNTYTGLDFLRKSTVGTGQYLREDNESRIARNAPRHRYI